MERFPVALLAAVLFTLLSRLIPLLDSHDPWLDESMLLANFPLASMSGLFEPLPYFEQAAPLGYAVLLNQLSLWFPDEPVLPFRIISVLASLFAAGLIIDAVRRFASWPVVALALATASLSAFMVRYSLEIKPYIFEYLATSLLMHASAHLLNGANTRRALYFVGASVFAVIFSFAAPITIGAFGTGVLAHGWLRGSRETRIKELLGTVGLLSITAAIFLIYYFGYTRPVTALQFASWAFFYDNYYLDFPPMSVAALWHWLTFPKLLIAQFDFIPSYLYRDYLFVEPEGILYPAFFVFFVTGLISSARISPFLPTSFICAVVLIMSLSVLGLLPIALVRHFTFLVPLTSVVAAFGMAACLNWCLVRMLPRFAPNLVSVCILIGVLAMGHFSYRKANSLEMETLSPLISHIVASHESGTPVWVYYAAQPAMKVLAPKSLVQIGLVKHKSDSTAWILDQRKPEQFITSDQYFEQFRHTIRSHSKLWLVFAHTWVEPSLERFKETAREEGVECREAKAAKSSSLWWCDRGQDQKEKSP